MTLDNLFQEKIGYLDWEFMIEEFPVEPDDPKPPLTGDDFNIGLYLSLVIGSGLILIILLLIWYRKQK